MRQKWLQEKARYVANLIFMPCASKPSWWWWTLRSLLSFPLMNTGWIVVLIFVLFSVRRFFTTLAEVWSLNRMITQMVGVVVSVDRMCCWFDTLEPTNRLTAKMKKVLFFNCLNYYFANTDVTYNIKATPNLRGCSSEKKIRTRAVFNETPTNIYR